MIGRTLLLLALTSLATLALRGSSSAQDAGLVHTRTEVNYDLRTDEGPVTVTWQVTVQNNDPSTAEGGQSGAVAFYSNLSLPVLRGAQGLTALDSAGEQLDVSVDESSTASVVTARVDFAERLFYEDTYEFGLRYELPEAREQSVLVTPAYVFMPIVASGDEATVTVVAPPEGSDWHTVLEAQDCNQDGAVFTCSGSDSAYIAATAEVSRPDAVATLPLQVDLQSVTMNLNLTYFQGEEASANHLRGLIPAALPLIEERFGVAHDGPATINVSQGGRESILGYEGITRCLADACEIIISPVADDITVIHELTHLWTDIYSERWLQEGFAQLIAEEVAGQLPPTLVQTRPAPRQSTPVDLPLDAWGEVTSIIGAAEEQLAIENAGYDLSLRFVDLLRLEVGNGVLRDVNMAIAQSGRPADSRTYFDAIEDRTRRNLDQLFGTWVFAPEDASTLELRRQARDRLAELEIRVRTDGLPDGATAGIREDIAAWHFQAAISKLDAVDEDINTYNSLSEQLSQMAGEASNMGLSLPGGIAEALDRWEFGNVRLAMADARDAIDAYAAAHAKVQSSRSLWQQFGLLGSDPDGQLDQAAGEFAAGSFQASIDSSRSAAKTIDDAGTVALRRVLIVTGIFAAFGLVVLAAVFAGHLRERGLADG